MLASFLGFGLGLVSPLLSQVAFDRVFVNSDAGLLGIITIAMVAVTLTTTILGAVKSYRWATSRTGSTPCSRRSFTAT